MSLVVLHLRWDDVTAAQYEQLCRLLPHGRGFPDVSCRSRGHRLTGRTVLGTEVWSDDDAAGRFVDRLPLLSEAAGAQAPQVVAFCLPEPYAGAWVRPADELPAPPVAAATVPEQRRAAAVRAGSAPRD